MVSHDLDGENDRLAWGTAGGDHSVSSVKEIEKLIRLMLDRYK